MTKQTNLVKAECLENNLVKETININELNVLHTGIQAWNEILDDGYRPSQLYTYMGLPGGYKTMIILKSVYDIMKYNGNIVTKEGPRKSILLITTEINPEEVLGMLMQLSTEGDEFNIVRDANQLTISNGNGIDVIIQYHNKFIVLIDDFYTIISNLEKENREIIALAIDYTNCIHPSNSEELELKTIAITKEIPVITSYQLNRDQVSIVDLTKKQFKPITDFTFEVIENSDWVGIINIEKNQDTGQNYLTFKRDKVRYKFKSDLMYFNHPFAEGSSIKLLDDMNLDKSLSFNKR